MTTSLLGVSVNDHKCNLKLTLRQHPSGQLFLHHPYDTECA